MRDALGVSVSKRQHAYKLLILLDDCPAQLFLIGDRHPAGIQSQLLRPQCDPFSVVSQLFFQIMAGGTYECNVV